MSRFNQRVCLSVGLSVCLSVCLSVREDISRTASPNFIKFSLRVAYGRGLILLYCCIGICCVLPVLQMTSCFATDATSAATLQRCARDNTITLWRWLHPVLYDGGHHDYKTSPCSWCRVEYVTLHYLTQHPVLRVFQLDPTLSCLFSSSAVIRSVRLIWIRKLSTTGLRLCLVHFVRRFLFVTLLQVLFDTA